jgi:hypothetical protein
MKGRILSGIVLGSGSPEEAKVDAYDLLLGLTNNRLLYAATTSRILLKNDRLKLLLGDAKSVGDVLERKYNHTVELIEQIAKQHSLDFALAKTLRPYPYISSDIDMVISQEQKNEWIRLLENGNWIIFGHEEFLKKRLWQLTAMHPKYTKIDITIRFGWQDKQYFDDSFILEGAKNGLLSEISDFAVNIGATAFKRMYVTYLDYLYYRRYIYSEEYLGPVRQQSQKYGWSEAFGNVSQFIASLSDNDMYPVLFPRSVWQVIFTEKIRQGNFSLNYFSYFCLSRLRYSLDRTRLPYLVYWYKPKKFRYLQRYSIPI